MAKFQFEKKQVLPAVGMAIASAGLFTYFVLKMTTPPPLQAAVEAPKPAQMASQNGAAGPNVTAGGGAGTPSDPLVSTDPLLSAPTDAMRNPFTPEIVDAGTLPNRSHPVQMAMNNLGGSGLP